jgi:hypothetical protein
MYQVSAKITEFPLKTTRKVLKREFGYERDSSSASAKIGVKDLAIAKRREQIA